MHPGGRTAEEVGVPHVVRAVADVGEGAARERSQPLGNCLQVGEDLAGVELVGQRVDHRDGRRLREFLDALLARSAPGDRGDLAGQHPRDIRDRLAAPDVRLGGVDLKRQAAEFGDADGEGHAGAQAWLVEEQGDCLRPGEGTEGLTVCLHRLRQVNDLGLLGRGEVVVAEEVPWHGYAFCSWAVAS